MSSKHTPFTQLTDCLRQSLSSLSESDRERVLSDWSRQKATVSSLMEGSSSSTRTVKDPNRPKKAKNVFLIYSGEMREKLKTHQPPLDAKEMLKEIGKRWKVDSTNASLMERLNALHAQEVERYNTAMASYVAPEGTTVATKTRRVRDPSAPKPQTGYNLHNKEMAPLLKEENVDPKERFKVLGARWKALTDAQREAYNVRAKSGEPAPAVAPAPASAKPSASRAKSPSAPAPATPAPAPATKQAPKKVPAQKKQVDSDDEELQEEVAPKAPTRKPVRK